MLPPLSSLRRRGLVRRGLVDPLVAAFAAESGATDVSGLNSLITYVRGQGLIDNFVIYPMKSAQNAGSGATVYSLGGLTTNNMTLVSSPTWGASGITFDGVADYGHIPDFLGSETLSSFVRVNMTSNTTGLSSIFSQFETTGNQRSLWLFQNGTVPGDPLQLNRSDDGLNSETYNAAITAIGSENCLVATWVDGGGRSFYRNKVEETLTLSSGTAKTSRFDSTADIAIAAIFVGGAGNWFGAGLFNSLCLVNTAVTTTQRETITDLINAL